MTTLAQSSLRDGHFSRRVLLFVILPIRFYVDQPSPASNALTLVGIPRAVALFRAFVIGAIEAHDCIFSAEQENRGTAVTSYFVATSPTYLAM